jgi:drug/metabolite transporter (DMT)-like permease
MTGESRSDAHGDGWRVVVAFGLVYVIWGSTYLGIRYAIQSIPPLLMAGARFFSAGAILFVWSAARGVPLPTRRQWRNAAMAGVLLLLGGNGLVTWAEVRVPSGITALLIATSLLWMVLLGWAVGGERPNRRAWAGIVCGLAGVGLLVGPGLVGASGGVDPLGAAALMGATLTWSIGTIVARQSELPADTLMATAAEMLTGGAALLAAGVLFGEPARFDLAHVTTTSWAAFGYLVVIGSLVAYSAYTYLVVHTTPAKLGTYAYVNPVVAVILGWLIAGEPIGLRTIGAMVVIVTAVAILTLQPRPVTESPPVIAPAGSTSS